MNTSVCLDADKGWLRLRWRYQGKSRCLYLGLPDTKTNRLKAKDTILQIEADIEAGCLDLNLDKYKVHKVTNKPISKLTCTELFQEWLNHKATHTDQRNIEWLRGTLTGLDEQFNKIAQNVTHKDAQLLFTRLKNNNLHPETIKRKLENLYACWKWAIENYYLTDNPWQGLSKLVKVPSNPMSKPFTLDEANRIIKGFTTHPRYSQLTSFVRFLFHTGCRTGEAIGLKWSDIADDCSYCIISEQLTRGKRKATKTGKVRTLYLQKSVQTMLVSLRATNTKPDSLVFLWNGKAIELNNFRARVWKPILKAQNVPYRTVYNTRRTFISHALEQGMSPVEIAQLTGHSVNVLFNHYAASLHKPVLPDLDGLG